MAKAGPKPKPRALKLEKGPIKKSRDKPGILMYMLRNSIISKDTAEEIFDKAEDKLTKP